jgi:hypothetical protein
MTVEERIKAIKDYLDSVYGYDVCDGIIVDVRTYGKYDKIVVSERRKGRGIQAMRMVNCISTRFGGPTLTDKTLVIGKDAK